MSSPVKVGLVQINNSFSKQNYLPLSVGLIQSYAQRYLKRPEGYQFLLPLYTRIPVQKAVDHLLDADIVFFSTYVWNFRISLEAARLLKARHPDTVIVFGGPHVPDRVEAYHRQHPFIDLACHGEGEAVATDILEHYPTRDWERVSSVSYLQPDGTLVQRPKAMRIKDLVTVSSPYLDGTFDPLIQAHPEEHWVALWETNRGCPFSCTFCDWGSATQAKVFQFDLERLYQEVDWFANHQIEYVFCCDANFGMLPRDLDIASYVADTKRKSGYPHALSVQNTKNATERAYMVQKILSDNGLNKGVTISLQSVDPTTLESIKRSNISTETYQELQRRFTRDRVETYSDVILGLPGETYESFANGVSTIMENGQHNRIQFNNLSILPNAEMGDPAYQQRYGMIMVETKIINVHGTLTEEVDEIFESQVLVVGTNTMSREDWVRVRAFSWMAALVHFDKTLQLPLILVHELCGVSYRELIELFSECPDDEFPVVREIRRIFLDKATDIQNGGPEYSMSEEWLRIWWPTDESVLIKLYVEDKLTAFYREAQRLIERFLAERFLSLPEGLLTEAIDFNRSLLKVPFQTTDLERELSYNLWEFYQSVLIGAKIPLERKSCRYHIDRTTRSWSSLADWCREVIWYGNKKGAYLYTNNQVEPQLAGHF